MPESPAAVAEIVALVRGRDLPAAARRLLAERPRTVTYRRDEAPSLAVDEVALVYGAGRPAEAVAAELLAIAAGPPPRAICPVPAEGDAARPGSWGVEDLGVMLAARACLPAVPWIRPDWTRLGPGACQVALAFGANDWVLPAGDRSDPEHLAAAVGWRAVPR